MHIYISQSYILIIYIIGCVGKVSSDEIKELMVEAGKKLHKRKVKAVVLTSNVKLNLIFFYIFVVRRKGVLLRTSRVPRSWKQR